MTDKSISKVNEITAAYQQGYDEGYKRGREDGKHNAKIGGQAVREIRELADKGEMSQSEIADIYGLSQPTVSNIIHRKIWKEVTS